MFSTSEEIGDNVAEESRSEACLKVGTEDSEGLFEGVGLIYSFGLRITLVDCHKGTPEFGEGAGKADLFGYSVTGDGIASVDAGQRAPG